MLDILPQHQYVKPDQLDPLYKVLHLTLIVA